jgi:hypothetical protein
MHFEYQNFSPTNFLDKFPRKKPEIFPDAYKFSDFQIQIQSEIQIQKFKFKYKNSISNTKYGLKYLIRIYQKLPLER